MEAEMMCLLLHHPLRSTGPYHVSGPPVKSSIVTLYMEDHGKPRLQAMGSHPWTTEHRQGPPLWSAADLIAAGDLHT